MFSTLRGILFQSSHLSPYLSIIKQTKSQKVFRLFSDQSNPNVKFIDHQHSHGHKSLNIIERLFLSKLPILNPVKSWMFYWYIILTIAILYYYVESSLVLFYAGAWEAELTTPSALAVSVIFLLILIADMALQFNSGFLMRGMIIFDRKRIVKNYLRGMFIFDLSFIIIAILCLATGSFNLNYVKFLWFTKIFRLSDIDDYFLRKFNVHRMRRTSYVITKLIIIILSLSHFIGVIFYIIDLYFLTTGYFQPAFCWLQTSTAYTSIIDLSWGWQYFYSLYWGINTIVTISYGDIAPGNPWEIIYVTFMMCFGSMTYGYVINQIIKIILWARGRKDKLRADMVVMDIYMDNLEIPLDVKNQVRGHLEFLHKQEKNRDINLEARMRDKLPEDLRYQLVSNAYSGFNQKIINIFQSTIATKFLFNLVEKKYTTDEPISFQGQRSLTLNYLHKGQAHFVVEYSNNKFQTIYQSSSENEFLGNYQFFSRNRHPFSTISKTGSIVYSIQRQKMFLQLNSIEQLREKFKQVQYEVVFKNKLDRIMYNCYFCDQNHDWRQCPTKFPTFEKKFKLQSEKKVNDIRVTCRRYHTLDDRKELQILKSIRNTSNKRLISTIQKRIAKIKQKISEKHEEMDIDIAFEWKHFDTNENLSKKKELWNQLSNKKRSDSNYKRNSSSA